MAINRVYHNWLGKIMQLRPNERITRVRNMAWLMTGIFESKSVYLSKVATKIPSQAKVPSLTRRMRRFLDNDAVRVRDWYEPIALGLLQAAANSVREIRLIIDPTKVSARFQKLGISLAFRRRALPIAWTWLKGPKGHSSTWVQLALLAYVHKLIPSGIPVSLVGDTEFESGKVIQQLEKWGWRYVLHQKSNNQVKIPGQEDWQNFGDLVQRPGESRWVTGALLTRKYALPVNLLAYWKIGEEHPWLLATNFPSQRAAWQAYKRRMWIDESFGDLKGHGFDLEKTRLRHFLRLSRLVLAVALLYVWLVTKGSQVIKQGKRHLVDRSDRRDLSIFQIGLRFIDRRLTNRKTISIRLCPYFS